MQRDVNQCNKTEQTAEPLVLFLKVWSMSTWFP